MAQTDDENDLDRRSFLKCMAWVGTGAVWTWSGGILKGSPLGQSARAPMMSHADGALRFVQISDSHIGFDKPANTDVTATLRAATAKIKAAPEPPVFVYEVVMDNFSFAPATASVPAGTTVTWTNHDDVPHNIVSTEQRFKSPVLDTDERFSHRFDQPGAYRYFCSLHPKMTGRVVVG